MHKKVLILGSNGNLGHMCTRYLLRKNHHVTTVARKNSDWNVDFEDINQVRAFVPKMANFDYVVNCLGILVAESEENKERAFLVNSWLPQFLSNSISSSKTKLIHISTDCVFNGIDGRQYTEKSLPNETKFYGYSKMLGEIRNSKDLTIRTSIIGPELNPNGTGLLNWFLNTKASEIDGWNNHYWNGMTTLELARLLELIINRYPITGLIHLTDNDFQISKYDLLNVFKSIFDKKIKINLVNKPTEVSKTLVSNIKLKELKINDFRKQMVDLKSWMLMDGRYVI